MSSEIPFLEKLYRVGACAVKPQAKAEMRDRAGAWSFRCLHMYQHTLQYIAMQYSTVRLYGCMAVLLYGCMTVCN